MWSIDTVAVVGSGEDAAAFARAAAMARCAVRLAVPDGAAERTVAALRFRVDAAVAARALQPADRQRILDGILVTSDLEEATLGADLAIDADGEPGGPAPGTRLARLGRVMRASAPIAVTAALDAAARAAVPQPGRVLRVTLTDAGASVPGLRVAPLPGTAPHALRAAEGFAERVRAVAGPRGAR